MNSILYLQCYDGINVHEFCTLLLYLGGDQHALDKAVDNFPGLCKDNSDYHIKKETSLRKLQQLTAQSMLSDNAKEIICRTLEILIEIISKLDHLPTDEISLVALGGHEVFLDVISAAILLDSLGIKDVIVPVLYEGTGTVCIDRKTYPVPVPAVAEIAKRYNIPLHITDQQGELITATGAAFVAAVFTSRVLPENFIIENTKTSGMFRAMLIRETTCETGTSVEHESDQIWKLECNLDDCRGEALGFTMSALFKAGARDVYFTPIYMKKNRPAYQLNVICSLSDRNQMEHIIFKNTTTIGIRRLKMSRSILKRRSVNRKTKLGEITYKVYTFENQEHFSPEYESLVTLCEKAQMSYEEAYRYAELSYNMGKPFTKYQGETDL